MSWNFLTDLLDEISTHSTLVGKIWLTMLVILRIVLTVVGAKIVYHDEQSNFVCNKLQPGCENVCYDAFTPHSQVRFWIFHLIMISMPSIIYLGFVLYKINRMNDEEGKSAAAVARDHDEAAVEADGVGGAKKHDGRRRIQHDGLMCAYVLQLGSRGAFEVSFLFGQYMLYGPEVVPSYKCTRWPCPNGVYCFVSRPMEKTIFLRIMYAISALCLALTLLEMLHLGIGRLKDSLKDSHREQVKRWRCHLPVAPRDPADALCYQLASAPPYYYASGRPKPDGGTSGTFAGTAALSSGASAVGPDRGWQPRCTRLGSLA